MNENENSAVDFNRRDFLKGGSVATLMTMLGGVELLGQAPAPALSTYAGPRMKVGVIGLGLWGREIVTTLMQIDQAEVAAICDTYPAMVRRTADAAPKAAQTADYKTILANKDIKAVIVATPTHKHKEIVLEALKAGKHVYCEAPLAHSVEDAREIALAAKIAAQQVFQAGFQMRSDPQRHFLLPFLRSGAIGKSIMARAQWHKKQSWRSASPKPEREKELNWRLSKETSTGLMGEIGSHAVDQVAWFLSAMPKAVTGFGGINFYTDDGRDVPDTVQAVFEFPGGVNMFYDATLANSFDGQYEIVYGSDAAVMLRESNAWLFKEVDSPLLGWEVYARKEMFYKETGIALVANASKAVVPTGQQAQKEEITSTPLFFALQRFTLNAADITNAIEDFTSSFGTDDPKALAEQVAKVRAVARPASDYLEGFRATVMGIKANEAILSQNRLVLKPEWYELS
ncbi:MAG TPA: Gfo/Idh/MocA family oxidoreductase [Verrucomicrobiae bacterium]|nr:Gfo/Idh/MocA family oxidoreductase [Verrucomicrobiae bacterium]